VANLFFLLSGENETLPAAELSAILEAEDCKFTLTEKLDQVVRLKTGVSSIEAVKRRAAYTRISALELFSCAANEDAITAAAVSVDFQTVLSSEETFAVRIHRVREYSAKKETMRLESSLGKHILENSPNTVVDLKKPSKTFLGILTSGKLVFGVKLAEAQIKTFSERRPRKKPFFHPSAMPSKLARCMVNLSLAKTGSLVLDPFCGTGSSLIEAALIKCRVLGADAQKRMIIGSRRNLKHFGVEAEGLVIADARDLPVTAVDCVVTDPPYGRSASTLRSTTKALVEAVLFSVRSLLAEGQRICIALPIRVSQQGQVEHMSEDLAEFVKGLGYKTIESHMVYVHRTLTREVMVYERT